MSNTRKILVDPEDAKGHFLMPQSFNAEDEVKFTKRRIDSTRVAQYADSKCGLSNTFDEKGAYLCGGLEGGGSYPCNKLNGSECLIRIKAIDLPHSQSCGFWETENAGDPEGRYCAKGKMDDSRINFGGTKNPKGFSCQRCEYGQQKLNEPDSEGRTLWCELKGHPVEPNACCADNEPVEVGKVPFKSKAQQGYFNANRKKLEAEGVNVDEWNQASKGKKLPARKGVIARAKERHSGNHN